MKLITVLGLKQLIITAACLCLIAGTPALAATTAANVTKLDGKAFAASSTRGTRKLSKNDRLYEQERIITGKGASIEITFTDGTNLTLGASTIVTVDSYAYQKKETEDKDASKSRFSLSILTDAVRAVTGLLAKRRPLSVRFKTKVATIGIRGTHFAAEVEGDSATIILLAQQDASAPNAIEVSNAFGKVEIDKAGWGTEVPDAKSQPSPPRKMRTTNSMNRIMRSIQTNRRVMVPRVRMH